MQSFPGFLKNTLCSVFLLTPRVILTRITAVVLGLSAKVTSKQCLGK